MRNSITLLTLALVPLTFACGVKKIDDEGGSGGDGVPAAVQARLNESCAVPGCHVAGATTPDLSAASGGAWVTASGAGGPFVTFGDVANSYLVTKMMPAPPFGSQMPIGREISAEDMAVIVGWVAGVEFPTDTDDSSAETMTDPTGDESSSGGSGSELMLCSLEMVAPDAESPVDAGDEAGKIPSSIGEALERNCGCHYSDDVEDGYFAYSGGGTRIDTLADFTNDYAGNVGVYMGQPAWMASEDRVITQRTMPMALCETEEGTTITQADLDLFEAWFDQQVPDGATFVPPE